MNTLNATESSPNRRTIQAPSHNTNPHFPMVLYNVTVSVDEQCANDWVKYMMEQHIPEVLATGHFRDFRLCHVQGEAEGGITFAVQYMANNAEALDTYHRECAPALQADHQAKWGSRAVAFRTILPLIAEGHPTPGFDPQSN